MLSRANGLFYAELPKLEEAIEKGDSLCDMNSLVVRARVEASMHLSTLRLPEMLPPSLY